MARIFRRLTQLLDVDTTGVVDGDALVYDDGTDTWIPGAGGGGGGSDDQTAAEVPFTPAGTIAATDTQAAVEEVATDAASALTTHSADTTAVHGIADTSALALTANHPTTATFNDHSARHENGGADEISIAGLDGTSAELASHLADATDAHDASAISIVDTGDVFLDTDVEGALQEAMFGVVNHLGDPTAAHAGTAISFPPSGPILSTDVTNAIVEVANLAVLDSLYDANSIVKADSDDTPVALTMGASTILARLAAGSIKAASVAEVLTLLDAVTATTFNDHSARHEDGGADEITIAGLAGIPTELQTHLDDTTAHLAVRIPFTPAGTIAATDVQAAIEEVASEAGGASAVSFIPSFFCGG